MAKMRGSVAVMALAIGILVAALIGTDRRAESSDSSEVGRFQIAVGNYSGVVGQGLSKNEDVVVGRAGVFKIDTTTGQTWVLSERMDTQSIIAPEFTRKWVPID